MSVSCPQCDLLKRSLQFASLEYTDAERAVLMAVFGREREWQAEDVSAQLQAAIRRKSQAESLIREHLYTAHPIEVFGPT